MKIFTSPSDPGFLSLLDGWCRSYLSEPENDSVFIPAGETPKPLYAFWEKTKPAYLNNKLLFPVDDVTSGVQTGIFSRFFEAELPTYQNQIVKLGEKREHRVKLAILGVGTNGHIAFHEPSRVKKPFTFDTVTLDHDTCKALKCEPETNGLSYGSLAFEKCDAILLIARGKSKDAILKRFYNNDTSLPITLLKNHKNLTVIHQI